MQDLEILTNSYLIIGAPKTKKSEISFKLSKILKYKLINLDREKYAFFDDFTDYDFNVYQNIKESDGEIKALNYIHKYEMKHLNYVINNIKETVIIDFGNTYTLIDNKELLNKIKLFKNIILLESDVEAKNKFDKKLSDNKVNNLLATIKINIDNKDIDNIVQEILNNKEFKSIL